MTDLDTVWAKTKDIYLTIKGVIRLSTFEQYDDLSGLNIDYEDAEQLFLLDELKGIMEKLSDVENKISYLSRPFKEVSRLRLNECGKYETKGGHFYACGYVIEALVTDDYHDRPRWIRTRVEHDGERYYLVGCRAVSLDGLTVRVREVQ